MRQIAPPLVVLSTIFLPALAHAWQQTTTCIDEPAEAPSSTPFCTGNEIPQPFVWPAWTVPYSVNERGYAPIDGRSGEISATFVGTIQEAMEVWNEPECSGFAFLYDGLTDVSGYVVDDGVNVVAFREDTWPYQASAVAITSVTAELDGTIVNADMELNAVENEFGFAEERGEEVWDLRNTITHEAGHMLGLDHSADAESTMAFNATTGEVKKRDLEEDDIEGLCAIYPVGQEPMPDAGTDPDPDPRDGDSGGCCTVASATVMKAPSELLGLLILLGLARVGGRRRSRRNRS